MLPRRQVPNALTVLRLILAASFFALLGFYRYPDGPAWIANLAIAVFVLAAVTDALDGWLARRWKATSLFGRIMDPFCDKVLVLGAFVYLAGPRFAVTEWADAGRFITTATAVPAAAVVLILARELLVTSVRGVAEGMGVDFGAQAAGKLKMILQSAGVPIILLVTANFAPHENTWAMAINASLTAGIVLVTLWSGWPYVQSLRTLMSTPIAPPDVVPDASADASTETAAPGDSSNPGNPAADDPASTASTAGTAPVPPPTPSDPAP
ncbi:MAG: CDP-alcohol phosphatidyltransferase family protein [Phycisphaerales bacterium]